MTTVELEITRTARRHLAIRKICHYNGPTDSLIGPVMMPHMCIETDISTTATVDTTIAEIARGAGTRGTQITRITVHGKPYPRAKAEAAIRSWLRGHMAYAIPASLAAIATLPA